MNGVAEVNESLSRQMVVTNKRSQLHSELVRTTILKDFVDFEGISKRVFLPYRLQRYSSSMLGSGMLRTGVSRVPAFF